MAPLFYYINAYAGEQIYRTQWASCHGANGDGTKKYPHALTGDRSAKELSKVIAATMPEDNPGACVGANADKVAAYIHDTFYSKAARERNHPPRVELSRLTAVQRQNAVADLVGSFRPDTPKPLESRSLRPARHTRLRFHIVKGLSTTAETYICSGDKS